MSAESSRRLMQLAEEMMHDDDPRVRSLAGSVLRQFEPDPGSPHRASDAQRYKNEGPAFWRGYWADMWACQR